jgi:hypothetical protein
VQWLETTPQEQIVSGLYAKIQDGLPYNQLLAALFLAGIRNVQPRPNVGFKFHSVLVIHAAHQASMAARDRDRWLPLLWSADYFKRAQTEDVRQGDWTMKEPPEVSAMTGTKAIVGLSQAMDRWDVEATDRYATAAARHASVGQLFELFARYGSRDFRDIGHKAIYVAGAFRLLDTIGHEHIEPVVRSLAYALLNYGSGSNPAGQDLEADRPGRINWERTDGIHEAWSAGTLETSLTREWLEGLRHWDAEDGCQRILGKLKSGTHWQTAYDALFLASSEMVLRQNAIVPLHAVTSTNAIHYLFTNVKDQRLRLWLLLQNTAFVCLLRNAAKDRGKMREVWLDQLAPADPSPSPSILEIFLNVGKDRDLASRQILAQLSQPDSTAHQEFMRQARNLVFCKGTDSHDYKFSSAILEDWHHVSPVWRGLYLAGCSHLLHGDSHEDSPLWKRTQELLKA